MCCVFLCMESLHYCLWAMDSLILHSLWWINPGSINCTILIVLCLLLFYYIFRGFIPPPFQPSPLILRIISREYQQQKCCERNWKRHNEDNTGLAEKKSEYNIRYTDYNIGIILMQSKVVWRILEVLAIKS